MKVRRAVTEDIDMVTKIYDKIHTAEENGEVTIGWKRGIYPVRGTAVTGNIKVWSMIIWRKKKSLQ